MSEAPKHDRAAGERPPHVYGFDGERMGEARNFDGDWYWVDGSGEARLVLFHPLPAWPDFWPTRPAE